MKSITNYIDELKDLTGSDYKTAKALNVDKTVISKIRSRNKVSDENAIKIAQLLEIDEKEILLSATIARSDGIVKKAWESISKKAGLLSFPIGAVCSGLYQFTGMIGEFAKEGVCILC